MAQNEAQSKWYQRNREAHNAKGRAWYQANKEKHHAIVRAENQRLKREVLTHYAEGILACACCAVTELEFLTIDHIHGGGSKHHREIKGHLYRWLKKNNFPEGYRVLCMNCNFALGHFNYCPHNPPPQECNANPEH